MGGKHCVDIFANAQEPLQPGIVRREIDLQDDLIGLGFRLQLSHEFVALMLVVEVFDRLLEADGDEQSYDDGGDVDEEIFPSVGGRVGRVYVEHYGSG